MIEEKINNFLNAPEESINLGDIRSKKLNDDIKIYWGEEPIGRLKKGKNIFSPITEALVTEYLDSEKKILVSTLLFISI